MVTLTSRKVYIGAVRMVHRRPLRNELKWIKITPFISGYRDEKKHEVHFVTHYIKAYRNIIDQRKQTTAKGKPIDASVDQKIMDDGSFDLTIAAKEISTVREFYPQIYLQFKEYLEAKDNQFGEPAAEANRGNRKKLEN